MHSRSFFNRAPLGRYLAFAGILLLLSGCGKMSSSAATSGPGGAGPRVGFIYIGAQHDYGYNQAHAEGAKAVKQLPGVTVVEEEMVPDTADVQNTMKSMIELDGANVIFATSFGYYDPHMLKIAAEYPNVLFLHCGGLYQDGRHPKNVGTYFAFIDECQYLSGIVAAHMTKTKKLGFVAGKPIPQVRRNINAFTLGARSVDPSITCTVIFNGDWSLPVKEAEATNNLIDHDIDVITCHVNSPKVVMETAERRGVYTCGYHFNQRPLAPNGYLTGAEWNWGPLYADYVEKIKAGEPVTGMRRGSLKDGFVQMSPYAAVVPDKAKAKVGDVKNQLIDGTFAIFKGPLKDNTGRIVIPEGVEYSQTAVELETIDYLVQGVISQ